MPSKIRLPATEPYLPYADSHPDAVDAFDGKRDAEPLTVVFPPELEEMIPPEKRAGLRRTSCRAGTIFRQDPSNKQFL